ncbi:ComEC family competence protein [Gimesia aquarii]|uniref:ComEC family competence protein n=2 Tax=Gimesia aquarii TaxID=2527964 RepID=A0A517VWF4_9PLAN|nr:ComEC family competence protein [Gimesia aquarii]
MTNCFVALPKDEEGKNVKTFLFKENRSKKVRQVLWGDWLTVKRDMGDGWLEIEWAPNSEEPELLYIPKEHTTDTRPLEIVFLDVGQGDGAVLITPERGENEAVMVIDSGDSDNMHDFLDKRFKPYNEQFQFHAAVITHPDQDHYQGFNKIFSSEKFGFDVVYHSGLVERPISGTFEKLGGRSEKLSNKKRYITALAEDKSDVERLFGGAVDPGDFLFPNLMRAALNNQNIKDFKMLSTEHGTKEAGTIWMPGFAPSDGRAYSIEVVGPVVETVDDGKPKLRSIGSYGETKNGHSVILRLHFGGIKILFGGDLNDKAEKFLLKHYAGVSKFPRDDSPQYIEMIKLASKKFRADIMKVCHHGSEKVTDAFLETVFPAAFVISSGDSEGHVHPRPDLLGRLGKKGRSKAPVILSTELQRSTREKEDKKLVDRLLKRIADLDAVPSESVKDKFEKDINLLGRSNVTVYGTIYLKTDGNTLITAFRIETGSETKKWFTFHYELDDEGELNLIG